MEENNNPSPESRPERDLSTFIPAALDDYGLPPAEFRVYCHISRRDGQNGLGCYAKIETIAKKVGYCLPIVRKALKSLVECQLIAAEIRAGRTTIYRCTPINTWHPSKFLSEVEENYNPVRKLQANPVRKLQGKGTHKRSTREGEASSLSSTGFNRTENHSICANKNYHSF